MAPVRLADEQELRVDVADRTRGVPPELPERRGILGRRRHRRPAAPGRPEDVVEDEHRLRAHDAVAAGGHLLERLGHRPGHVGVAVVELGRIGPWREVRVATVGDPVAAVGPDLEVLVGIGGPLRRVGVDEPVRMSADPEVLGRDVVRDEVQDQPEAGLAEALAQPGQAGRAAQAVGRLVGADRIRRPDDVVVRAIGQEFGASVAQRGRWPATAGDCPSRSSRRPSARRGRSRARRSGRCRGRGRRRGPPGDRRAPRAWPSRPSRRSR